MLVLCNAAVGAAGRSREVLGVQSVQRLSNRVFIQTHHRLAVVLLIAGVDQSVQGERIVIWGSNVFLHQSAEYAGFYFVQEMIHSQIVQNNAWAFD
jgi:hypothetical protein